MRDPFPCQWPDNWKQTPPDAREDHTRFVAQFAQDRDALLHEIELLGGANAVITSNLPTRGDGRPYANARCENPAIAVYWTDPDGKERVIACDRWKGIDQNLRAILKTIQAIRGIERWGASEIIRRAVAGFTALPEKTTGRAWWRDHLGDGETIQEVRTTYRELMRTAHPDAGGDHAYASILTRAMKAAEIELGGPTT